MIPPEDQHEPSGAVEIDYKFLAENCSDILCSVGADHAIRYVSPSALDTLNWDPGEMIGKDFDEFVFSEDVAVLGDIAMGSAEDGAAYSHVRVRLLKKDQTLVWTSINARCVRDPVSGEPRVYVLSMRDITGRKVLEEKLSTLAMTDALTGLWNRRAFDQALRREWKRAIRDESQLGGVSPNPRFSGLGAKPALSQGNVKQFSDRREEQTQSIDQNWAKRVRETVSDCSCDRKPSP